ncbi:hypothetical protein AVEN_127880-1 [Araneus ventricosus]|uniref:Transposase IS30-like HTH domain-containing protein n=1 Tax=Araneus ventricosus TaxID=182803 RepID=A0A4Y1ZYY8_ARAVE|nr:hypothetical protein AVEN_127880-1 [Araneus ventricosus]
MLFKLPECYFPSRLDVVSGLKSRMSFRRQRRQYQQLNEYERGHITGLRERRISSRNIAERLCRDISTVHDCWQQWSKESSVSRRPGCGRTRATTDREDRRIRHMTVWHHTASAEEIRAVVGTRVTQRTVTN